LFSEKLHDFGKLCREKNAPVLALYDVGNLEEIKKYNSISVDGDGRITFFEEKPKTPTSTLTGIALYFYPAKQCHSSNNTSRTVTIPTSRALVQWLYPRTPFYTWRVPGSGSTSARRKPWKRRTRYSAGSRSERWNPEARPSFAAERSRDQRSAC